MGRGATVIELRGAGAGLDVRDDDWVTLDLTLLDRAPLVGSLLIVADVRRWVDETAAYLRAEGFEITVDATGRSVDGVAPADTDALLVDFGLTARPGPEICAAWRDRTEAPIFAVAAGDDEATAIAAFAAGVDAFCSSDVSQRQLLARIRSMLRRFPPRRRALASVPDDLPVGLDEQTRCAVVLGTKIPLTDAEFAVLRVLVLRAGRVVSRDELVEALHTGKDRFRDRSLDFVVRRVREKLETVDTGRRIMTVRGVGFRFEPMVGGGEGA